MKKLTSNYILRRLTELRVVSFREPEFRALFHLEPTGAYSVLHRLTAAGYLVRLANGRYVVAGFGTSPAAAHAFYIGTRLVEPSYVSFLSSLHYYGWTDQAPRLVSLATTRLSGRRAAGGFSFRFVKLRRLRFFGYTTAREGEIEFPIAEPEKAIVDALFLPRSSGGTTLVAGAVRDAAGGLDTTKLADYAIRMGSRSLASRLGHLLDRIGIRVESLRTQASSVYVPLDPAGPRRGRYDARWRIINNVPEAR